jgi:hypothetical protein
VDGVWIWEFSWRRSFFDWETPLYHEFLGFINEFEPTEGDDTWLWKEDKEAGFTVKGCYFMLLRLFREQRVFDRSTEIVFSRLWKGGVLSKVCAFSWKMLLNRIPTKENLHRRRMLQQQNLNCVLCDLAVESTTHLFLHCDKAASVWYAIMKWLGLVIIVPPNLVSSFVILGEYGKGKKGKLCLSLI